MDGRYEVFEFKGKGVFSSVLRARDRSRAIAGSATPSPAEGGESAAEVRRPFATPFAPSRRVSCNGVGHLTCCQLVSVAGIEGVDACAAAASKHRRCLPT